jgi:hypothetical protein|tara:strand:+ start:676 stop:1122 length:447 start_codon:yes stop_codon:yes gene_type:complete
MKTTLFGFTLLIAITIPLAKYLMTYSGLGGMYGVFWKQFPPSVYIASTLLIQYGISFAFAFLLAFKLELKNRLPSPLAGRHLIWIGGLLLVTPTVLRIFTSMVQGGGASFVLMSIASPFILVGKILFYIGIFQLLLAIKPNEKFSYAE